MAFYSYVTFRGGEYTANTAALEVWLHLLVEEIDRRGNADAWLSAVRDDWNRQSTAGFGYGVVPKLDQFVTTEEQRATLLSLSDAALRRLESYGAVLTKDELNAMGTGGERSHFTGDVPAAVFKEVGAAFIRLLRSAPDRTAEGD